MLWQDDGESASFTRVTFYINTSTKRPGNRLDQTQSKTGTVLCSTIITPVKSFKDMGEIIFRYTDTRVAHCNCDLPIIRFERNCYVPLRWSELQGIVKESLRRPHSFQVIQPRSLPYYPQL